MSKPKDVTPADSVVPVFRDDTPLAPSNTPEGQSFEEIIAAQAAVREEAIEALVAGKPLTEEQARVVTGT